MTVSSRPQHDRERWQALVHFLNGDEARATIVWAANGCGAPPVAFAKTSAPKPAQPPLAERRVTVTGWIVTSPELCKSLNQVRDWRQRHADTQRWERALRAELTLRPPATPPERADVSITRRYAGRCREFDFDDFVGGAKALLDALNRLGWLKDDSPSHVKVTYLQERGERSETVIGWAVDRS